MVFVWKVIFLLLFTLMMVFRLSCAHNLARHDFEISIKYST